MTTTQRAGILFIAATALIGALIFNMVSDPAPVSVKAKGTSMIVLVDFSKSFAASLKKDGSVIYGLQPQDRRAMYNVATAIADLATSSWTPPLKTVWAQIQSSSIATQPLCAPLETDQRLVKPEGSVGTRAEILEVLNGCATSVMDASKSVPKLSNYTDVSGAVSMASDVASGEFNERVIVMLSDFKEDLPPATQQASFQLNGEKIVLLHRPGIDESDPVGAYLDRVNSWIPLLKSHGASNVVSIPVFAASESRLRAALLPKEEPVGTSMTILVDFKDNVLPSSRASDMLAKIGKTIADQAKDWPAPVTVLWVAIGTTGFSSMPMPPVEFAPRLIKKGNVISTTDDFSMAMEELSRSITASHIEIHTTDIIGSIALTSMSTLSMKSSILIVISDFLDSGISNGTKLQIHPSTHVIMMHSAALSDRTDPNAYMLRRSMWEQRFKDAGASLISQIPLNTFTPNDLKKTLENTQ